MSTAVLGKPDVQQSDIEDLDHYFCCDPDISCCGLDISGIEEIGAVTNLCEECDLRSGTDCGDPRCPYRSTRQVSR